MFYFWAVMHTSLLRMKNGEIFLGDKFIRHIFWMGVKGYYMAGYGMNAFDVLCLCNVIFCLHIYSMNVFRSMNVKWNGMK